MWKEALERFRWTDLAAVVAILASLVGYARVSYEQGRLEGEMNQRLKAVEDSSIDAKASIRIVPALQGDIQGVRSELSGLRSDIRDTGNKVDALRTEVYRRNK